MFNHRGFTFIEMIIAISIASLLILIVTLTYQVSDNTYRQVDRSAELSQNGRVFLDRFARELRQTPDIITILPETSTSTPTASEIVFEDGHDMSRIQYIRYYLEENTIKRQLITYALADDPETTVYSYSFDIMNNPAIATIEDEKIISEHVESLSFWGDTLVSIEVMLTKNNYTIPLTTTVYARNI
jgi:prepilin-type N-terminal cleavage/methylation domain-containing protein